MAAFILLSGFAMIYITIPHLKKKLPFFIVCKAKLFSFFHGLEKEKEKNKERLHFTVSPFSFNGSHLILYRDFEIDILYYHYTDEEAGRLGVSESPKVVCTAVLVAELGFEPSVLTPAASFILWF